MNRSRPFFLLGIALAFAAAFVLYSSQTLPPVVASHFAADGRANGFMPRSTYIVLMLGVTVGLPLFIATLQGIIHFMLPALLAFMPNASYWFAPERYEATCTFLRRHGNFFPATLTAFLSFMHWQVVRANTLKPPLLTSESVIPAVVLFVIVLLLWIGVLIVRFARRA